MSTTAEKTALPTGTWSLDPVHSEIGFRIAYMAGTFKGTFSELTAGLVDGGLVGTAQVSSVQVKDPNLEAHLQSPEFFDAERHPQLGFRSQEIRREGDELTVAGEITIKGETRPIELRGTINDPSTDPWGNERLGLELEGAVDRTVFGLDWNNPLPNGQPALADDVTLVASLQLVQAA